MTRALAALLLAAGLVGPAGAATPPSDDAVRHVASQLRCVVCQNLSVADSPSEMAKQMREVIRERLAQGDSEEQVMRYFEERYGPWVRLSPTSWIVWVLPFAGLAGVPPLLALAPAGLASALWYAFLIAAGTALGDNWDAVKALVEDVNSALAVAALVFAAVFFYWLRRRVRRA